MMEPDEARARLECVEEGDMWTATNLLDVATLADAVERMRAVHSPDSLGYCRGCHVSNVDEEPYRMADCPTLAALDGREVE